MPQFVFEVSLIINFCLPGNVALYFLCIKLHQLNLRDGKYALLQVCHLFVQFSFFFFPSLLLSHLRVVSLMPIPRFDPKLDLTSSHPSCWLTSTKNPPRSCFWFDLWPRNLTLWHHQDLPSVFLTEDVRGFCPHPPPAFADMALEDVREYEKQMHEKTNIKVCLEEQERSSNSSPSLDGLGILDKVSVRVDFFWNIFFLSEIHLSQPLFTFYIHRVHGFPWNKIPDPPTFLNIQLHNPVCILTSLPLFNVAVIFRCY